MNLKNTVIVATSRLVDLAGSEVTTLELIEGFRNIGWVVSVAAFELSDSMRARIDDFGVRYFDLSDQKVFLDSSCFDLAWIHHNVSAYRILLDNSVTVKKAVFSSLSYCEPIECPPISALRFCRYLVNSQKHYEYFINKYPEFKKKTSVFHNSVLSRFWVKSNARHSPVMSRLAVVSNHIPVEVHQLINMLAERKVEVDVFGVEGRRELVTPKVLHEYDAVITIGKTVQYCIASQIPVYCYDHFGGDGWVTPESFDKERAHNFSGRGGRGKVEGVRMMAELFEGYTGALVGTSKLYELGRRYFVLEDNVAEILSGLSFDFHQENLLETDVNIVIRQNELYLKQRHIIANFNQLLSSLNDKITMLNVELGNRDDKITTLNVKLENRDDKITRLGIEVEELFRIKRSYSWRLTHPLRTIARWLVNHRNNLQVSISWTHFLLKRSVAVILHQGVGTFVTRALRYTNAWGRRKIAANMATSVKRIQEGASEDDSKKILISFVIPAYDRTDVLRIAINSALDQTVKNIEVIIVTDGSPQETLSVVNEFLGNPRVRIFNFPCSSGNAVRGRNKGICEARGRYIAFLDSDDIATPERSAHCLPLLESGEADVVYGAWQAVLDGSRDIPGIIDGQTVFSPDADLKMLLDVCVPCQSTVIVRKSLFGVSGLLKPTMQYREDHELWARLAYCGGVFRSVPNVLAKLRLHCGNNELNFKDNDNHWIERVHAEYKMPGPKPKKIAFILPGIGISGGVAIIFKHAALLMENGHDSFVINAGEMGNSSWFDPNPVPIVHVSDPRSYLFDGIDMLFATGWNTVEWLNRLPAMRKLYFVQSDERRFFDEQALKKKIHETYLTPCEYLTEALWIKKMLRDEFGHDAAYVPNGIDIAQFFPDISLKAKMPGKMRVLLEGPIIIPFKGMADSYAAIEGLDCEVWIVSSAGKPPKNWKYDRFFEGVSFREMRRIYSSCDILLKMSRVEGFFGPPMEAMACGCSVVVGKVTGYEEYIVNEGNAIVVEQGDIQGAKNAVQRLMDDDGLRKKLIQGGFDTIRDWSWERSARAMLSIVNKGECPVGESDLKV